MKKIKITVRWFDGFKRDFFPVEYEFGNSYLWMKFEDKEEWLPQTEEERRQAILESKRKYNKTHREERTDYMKQWRKNKE